MIIKEAFRYQNYLSDLLDDTLGVLMDKSFTTKTTEEHCMSKYNKDAEDEIIEVVYEGDIECSVDELIKFADHLVAAKSDLSDAIYSAKKYSLTNMDCDVATNKDLRRLHNALSYLGRMKNTEKKRVGSGYKFNEEGNQVTYNYMINVKSENNFDRDFVRDMAREVITLADEKSSAVDKMLVTVEVDYKPEFDMNGTLSDAIEVYLKKEKSEDAA